MEQLSLKELIFSLCGIMSVSGFEERGTKELFSLLGAYFDKTETDSVGNHFLYKYSKRENAPTVLVDAHFDEIGLIVTDALDGGFVRVANMGGIDPSIMQGADAVIYADEPLRAVVASTPPHLRKGDGKELPDMTEMLIDTGFDLKREELLKKIPVGTPVGFPPSYCTLSCEGDNGVSMCGKSFDDKACGAAAAYAIIGTPAEELAASVCLLLSSYEETSRLGGVYPASYRVNPDYALVLDVNLARVPSTKAYETVPYAKGISVSMSAATDRALTRETVALCEEREIPYCKVAAASSTGTNAPSVNLSREGIPVVDVGLPLKNMHTYNEVISQKDVDALVALVGAFITSERLARLFGREGA